MNEAGCKVAKFHHRHIRNIGVMNERDHRKIVVLDGRIAFVGGHCIVDEWLGEGQDKDHFRDYRCGCAARSCMRAIGVQRELGRGNRRAVRGRRRVSRSSSEAGDVTCVARRVLKPEGSAPAVKILHHTVICLATQADLDPEPLLHPGARRDRCVRRGGRSAASTCA